RARLVKQRHAARLELTDIELRRGNHAALLAELTELADEYPLDERVAGQLMLALYRSGRPADALGQYRQVWQRLTDELGTDPSPQLQGLHQQMLAADPALVGAQPPSTPQLVPRQMPLPPRLFTGRTDELARLGKDLDDSTMVISAICGTGGIGKTWLALQWAHQHHDRFPDGQLYVNLRGFDPSGRPMPPATAIRTFLTALGVESTAIPTDPEAQPGLYRSLVAGKRMLIVLDNAVDTAQVAPLLPGSPGCTVLVTSRRQLTGLAASHGARLLTLDVLSEPESRDLLALHLGGDRLADEPDAVAELLDYCAGLPLALSIVAARAANRPDFPLAALADELRDHTRRLDALDAGEADASLRAVLS
ncbi:MAG: BTAD domain-containing putative transcriptional regulator, partial [Pseudonocardiaceae bacterium]